MPGQVGAVSNERVDGQATADRAAALLCSGYVVGLRKVAKTTWKEKRREVPQLPRPTEPLRLWPSFSMPRIDVPTPPLNKPH